MEECYSRFLEGDRSALKEIIREYQEGLLLYINSIVHDMTAADELCSEVFVKLAVKKPKYRGGSTFRTFLYGIGRNTALCYLRKNKKRPLPLDEAYEIPDNTSVEGDYLQKERSAELYKAIGRLKAEQAQAIWLSYFEDLSDKEIASVMKRSQGAVRSLLFRAREALRRELEKEGFSYDEL